MASPQQASTPRWPLPGQAAQRASSAWSRFWKSFGGWKPQSKIAFGIGVGCSFILATCVVCSSLTVALAALSPSPTASSNQISPTSTTAQQVIVPGNATATAATQATATASPTMAKPTPIPSKAPTKPPAPTKTPCASPCNPWGYNFTPPGNLIYSPPSNFCSYFACIANFPNGKGYVMECQDAKFSKSGGISGSCSQHGGNLRPLYSH